MIGQHSAISLTLNFLTNRNGDKLLSNQRFIVRQKRAGGLALPSLYIYTSILDVL